MAESYVLGAVARCSLSVRTDDGDPVDPESLAYYMLEPDGTLTTYVYGSDPQIARESMGEYHVDWPTEQAGRHRYRWDGDGVNAGADEESFRVQRSRVL